MDNRVFAREGEPDFLAGSRDDVISSFSCFVHRKTFLTYARMHLTLAVLFCKIDEKTIDR